MFTEYLPSLTSMKVVTCTTCAEENLTWTSRVVACIETEVSCNILKRESFCEGCAENRPSQNHKYLYEYAGLAKISANWTTCFNVCKFRLYSKKITAHICNHTGFW